MEPSVFLRKKRVRASRPFRRIRVVRVAGLSNGCQSMFCPDSTVRGHRILSNFNSIGVLHVTFFV